jgi:hypothetical protein
MGASLGFFERVLPGFSLSLGSELLHWPHRRRAAAARRRAAAGVTVARAPTGPGPRAGLLVRPRISSHGTRRVHFDGQAPPAPVPWLCGVTPSGQDAGRLGRRKNGSGVRVTGPWVTAVTVPAGPVGPGYAIDPELSWRLPGGSGHGPPGRVTESTKLSAPSHSPRVAVSDRQRRHGTDRRHTWISNNDHLINLIHKILSS